MISEGIEACTVVHLMFGKLNKNQCEKDYDPFIVYVRQTQGVPDVEDISWAYKIHIHRHTEIGNSIYP